MHYHILRGDRDPTDALMAQAKRVHNSLFDDDGTEESAIESSEHKISRLVDHLDLGDEENRGLLRHSEDMFRRSNSFAFRNSVALRDLANGAREHDGRVRSMSVASSLSILLDYTRDEQSDCLGMASRMLGLAKKQSDLDIEYFEY